MTIRFDDRSIASIMLVGGLLVFGGAFLQQLIMGPDLNRVVPLASRIINAATYIPVYLCGLLIILRHWKLGQAELLDLLPLTMFAALAVISLGWAADRGMTAYDSFTLVMTIVVAISLPIALPFERFIAIASYTLLGCAIASIVYIFLIPSWGRMATGSFEFTSLAGLPQGVFRHKNQLAEVMGIGFICAICVGKQIPIFARTLLFVASAYCIIVSGSAGKIFGLSGALIALLSWHTIVGLLRMRFAAILLVVIILAISLALLPIIFGDLLASFGKDETLTGRTHLWAHAFRYIDYRPMFGWGLGSIWDTPLGSVPGVGYHPPHAHNLWIELALRLGVVGVGVAAWFFLKFSLDLLTSRRESSAYFNFAFLVLVSTLLRSPTEVSVFEGNDITSFLMVTAPAYHYLYVRRKRADGAQRHARRLQRRSHAATRYEHGGRRKASVS